MTKKKKIHFVAVIPTHYHSFFFQAVSETSDLDLTVHYISESAGNYPWKSDLRSGYHSRICNSSVGIDWILMRAILTDDKAIFYFAGWENTIKIFAIILCVIFNRPFLVGTDTPNLSVNRGKIKSLLRSVWITWIGSKCFKFLTTGRPGIDTLKKMGIPPDKLVDFPFYVDLNFFQPPKMYVQNSKILIFSSGRLVNSHKGHDLALRVIEKLKNEKSRNIRFSIAGTGTDLVILQELTAKLGLKEDVMFLGWKEPSDIAELLRNCDVFLHASHFDPFPNAVLEAMASGCLVISSNAAGSAIDRITPFENGLIFQDGDEVQLLELLDWACDPNNNQKIQRMRTAARLTSEARPVSEGVECFRLIFEQAHN